MVNKPTTPTEPPNISEVGVEADELNLHFRRRYRANGELHTDIKPANANRHESNIGRIYPSRMSKWISLFDDGLMAWDVLIVGRKRRTKIVLPPGHRVEGWLRFAYSKKTFDAVFAQALIDARTEYFDALAAGEKRKAAWRRAQLYYILAGTVLLQAATSIGKRAFDLWKSLSP